MFAAVEHLVDNRTTQPLPDRPPVEVMTMTADPQVTVITGPGAFGPWLKERAGG
jgi:hypothetical protein